MANRFLSNININDEYTLPSADGTADQIITTDGAGQLSFVDQSTLESGSAERTEILVKNLEGSALSKGDPVYIIGSVGASERLEVGLADAGDVDKMPCVGLLTQDLAINGEGTAIVTGKLKNLITSPIDGATPTENDTIYVKSGGGLTLTKPTGSTNLIQNVGQVGRVSTSSDGNIVVSAILRTNDVPNLTTGKIWVGSNTNTTESTVVHLDETNGRMGIGTTSPAQKLHVDGSIRVGDTNDVIYADKFFTVSNANLHIGANNGYDTVFFNGPADERMRITSTGNVGIGTTSPSYKLEVNGTFSSNAIWTTASSVTEWGSGTTAYGTLTWDIGYAKIFANSGNQLQFAAGGASTDMTIDTSGNVGIGTTSPSQKLQVSNGDVMLSSGYALHLTTTADHTKIQRTNNGLELFANSSVRMHINDSGNVGIGTTSPNQKLHIDGTTSNTTGLVHTTTGLAIFRVATNNSDFALLGQGGSNRFDIYDNNAGSTRFSINSSGNIGIGTTSPFSKLEVVGDTSFALLTLKSPSGGTSDAFMRFFDEGAGGSYSVGQDSSDGKFKIAYDVDGNSLTTGTKLVIDTSGNVGIGTTSPGYKLDVAGDLRVDNGNVGSTSGDEVEHVKIQGARHFLKFKEVRTANDSDWRNTTFKIQAGVDSTNHQSIDFVADGSYLEHIDIRTGNQVFNTRFTSSGNVGIGTTSPSGRLTIGSGVSTDNSTMFNVNGQYNDVGFNGGTSGLLTQGVWSFINSATWDQTRFYVQDQNNSNSRLTFDFKGNGGNINILAGTSSGKVGIGTTSPVANLHVSSGTSNEDCLVIIESDTDNNDETSNPRLELRQDGGGVIGRLGYRDNTNSLELINQFTESLYLGTDNSIDLTILSGGNVGIGTTSPSQKLDVVGSAQITSDIHLGRYIFHDGDGNTWLGFPLADTISFRTNGSDRIYINSSGNVGIGTTSPGYKLDVNGVIRGEQILYLKDTGGTNRLTIQAESSYVTQSVGALAQNFVANYYRFYDDAFSEMMRIADNGNVGIGTTNPASQLGSTKVLDISSTGNGEIILDHTDAGVSSDIGLYSWNRNNDHLAHIKASCDGATDSAFISFHAQATGGSFTNAASNERMRVTSSGDVGIGTTSPDSKLHVKEGDITIEGYNTSRYLRFIEPDGSFQGGYVNYNGASNILKIGVHNANDTNTANDTDAISIPRSSGNVGIGTTNPGEKLEVNGTVKATASTDAYKGYIKNTITCTPLMKTANTNYNYIPYNSTIFGSTPDYYNRMAAAYDGRVKKIILRHISGTTPTATGMKFKKEVNGTVSTTEYTATVTGGASASFTAIYNFANSDFTFSEGDSIGILAQTSGGTGNIGGASVQIILEYNIT